MPDPSVLSVNLVAYRGAADSTAIAVLYLNSDHCPRCPFDTDLADLMIHRNRAGKRDRWSHRLRKRTLHNPRSDDNDREQKSDSESPLLEHALSILLIDCIQSDSTCNAASGIRTYGYKKPATAQEQLLAPFPRSCLFHLIVPINPCLDHWIDTITVGNGSPALTPVLPLSILGHSAQRHCQVGRLQLASELLRGLLLGLIPSSASTTDCT